MKGGTNILPSDIRRVLSYPKVDGEYNVKSHETTNQIIVDYQISRTNRISSFGSLVDRGSNGGLDRADVRVISKSDRMVDVTGIDDHQMVNLPLVTAGGVVDSQKGEVLEILNHYSCAPNGKTIH